MAKFDGKAAVVTGGGSGIGRGLAEEIARRGARVAVADIKLENAQATVERIKAAGGKALAIHCDVCDRASITAMQQAATEALGPVTLLFANAGATSFLHLMEMSDDDVDWIIHVNLMGVIYTTRAFLPGMIAAGGGNICATASMAGLMPAWVPAHAPYSAAKMGIIGFMMNMQRELLEHNIFTNSYCPGAVASGMKSNNGSYRPQRFGGPEPVVEVKFATSDTTHSDLKFYKPSDIAPIVLRAVENNRPFVFDHADQRRLFRETYSRVVEACYDDIDAWEAETRHAGWQPLRRRSDAIISKGNPYG